MDIKEIKKRYENAYIKPFGEYEIFYLDKNEVDWLIAQTEKAEELEKENIAMKSLLKELGITIS